MTDLRWRLTPRGTWELLERYSAHAWWVLGIVYRTPRGPWSSREMLTGRRLPTSREDPADAARDLLEWLGRPHCGR